MSNPSNSVIHVLWKRIRSPKRVYFYLYYVLKVAVLKLVIGSEAIAYVLHDSFFPDLVLKIGGARIGSGVRVGRWLTIHESRGTFKNLEIGDDVFIGKRVLIDLSANVKIGNRCSVGARTTIITHVNYGSSSLSVMYPRSESDVVMLDDSQIAWGCIIVKGTVIGKQVLVLPGSVAGGTLKDGATYGGNPARQLPRAPAAS